MKNSHLKRGFPLAAIVLLVVTALLLSSLSTVSSPVAYAQRDTPTNTGGGNGGNGGNGGGGGGGGGGDGEAEHRPPSSASVSGMVYDYSSNMPVGNVVVVLEGNGWSLETLSNSDGYYSFMGLGMGSARLSLRLPPGAHPVTNGWQVFTDGETGHMVNLGYYWGDTLPVSIPMSAVVEPQAVPVGGELTVSIRIDNVFEEPMSGGVVDVRLPKEVQSTDAEASAGTVDFGQRRVRFVLPELRPGEHFTATVKAQVVAFEAGNAGGRHGGLSSPLLAQGFFVEAAFTYDGEITPLVFNVQVIPLDGGAVPQAGATPASALVDAAAPTTTPTAGTSAPTPTTTTEETPLVIASAPTSTPLPDSTEAPTPTPTATPAGETEGGVPLPTTGDDASDYVSWGLLLPAILMILIGVGGARAALHRE